MMFPNLPNGPTDLPGLGKVLLILGTVILVATLLIANRVEFLEIHFTEILLMSATFVAFGLVFIFVKRKKIPASDDREH